MSALKTAWQRFRTALGWLAAWLAASLIFGLAYTQSHLYNDNQNTKFLHGLARAGLGLLHEDWLANTADPLPAFSLLAQWTQAYLSPTLFYTYFMLLMGVYALALTAIAAELYRPLRSTGGLFTLFAFFLAAHSIWGQITVHKALGVELELLHFGLAGQYLLGLDFQNSSFGVFLLLSIYAFLRGHYARAMICLDAAMVMHPAYLFSAGLLAAAYLLLILSDNLRGKRFSPGVFLAAARQPFLLGWIALLPALALVAYNQVALDATSADLNARALAILVHERIPHHSLPAVWLDGGAWFQIAWMAAALLLARKTRLFWVMALPLLGGLAFTLAQITAGSDSLALLAPWRVSTILVPLATTLILARLVSWPWQRYPGVFARLNIPLAALALIFMFYCVQNGQAIQRGRDAKYFKQKTLPMMNAVRADKEPGDVYLVPPRDNRFDEFRLYTGAPILINWKSHPYRDVEVLEWYQRNQAAQAYYASPDEEACARLAELQSAYPLTHVVVDLTTPRPVCTRMSEQYRDQRYAVYALEGR